MQNIRVVKLDYIHFVTCFKFGVWGAKQNRLKNWDVGETVIFKVENEIAAIAKTSGSPFTSEDMIWDDDIYPYRLPIEFIYVVSKADRSKVSEKINKLLLDFLGTKYGWFFLTQKPLPTSLGEKIVNIILDSSNELSQFRALVDKEYSVTQSKIQNIEG